jgi:ubiquinone/menaquinone biosynthesis C-methylase UbiE
MDKSIERGTPAEYGQEIVKRRGRITSYCVSLRGKLILDFGCGNGAQTIELSKQGCGIIACDIDAGDLAVLTEYVAANSIKSVDTVLYDGTKLPLPDFTFDVAVSYAVLEHVEDEVVALRELYRVLKPSGEIVLSVPNKWWVFETHGARLPLLSWNRVPFFSWLPKSIHKKFAKARIYTKREVVNLLVTHGFEVLASSYMTAPMDMVKSPVLKKLLRTMIFRHDQTMLPILSTEIFLHCRKR